LFFGLDELAHVQGATPELFESDARRLGDLVPAGSAGGVITSPPYAGTYDYAEHQRLRFDFLGLRHRAMDEGEIGSRRSFIDDIAGVESLGKWRRALADSVSSIAAALAPGALAALVIGDSVARHRAVYALDDVRDALTSDLAMVAWASQQRPMLGLTEKRAFGDRWKAEHIILLRRL
jgi:DNA modification methylase